MELKELKEKNQWINWNYKENTKVPVSSKNQKTGSNPKYKNTWSNFKPVEENKIANGIGLVLTEGVCGIDIDKRDLEDPVTQDIFKLMDTYTEYSPSGKGFHILFMVNMEKLPKDLYSKYYKKNPQNHIECYISGLTNRYFTFTENVIINKSIEERTEQVLTFLEKYMLRKNQVMQNNNVDLEEISKDIVEIINNSKQAEKFQKLYLYGDTSEYNEDDSSADMALCCILAYYCGEDFELIDTIFRQSKLYRKKWNREDYKNNTIEKAIKKCEGNYYKNGINFRILYLLKKWKTEEKYSHNDIGMSDLFADIYKMQLVYNVNAKQWYHYDGKVWLEDTGDVIAKQKMKEMSKALIAYASRLPVIEENGNSFFKYVSKLGNHNEREKILKDAQSKIYVYQTDFDKNGDLFNCQNGTLNLKTFEFTLHNPTDLLSKISNVIYDSQALCSRFEKFMGEIMLDNKEKVDYIQRAIGYSLTTDTSQETCFILYGPTTRNGKGTLTDTILYMFGDYAKTASPETLAIKTFKDSTRPNPDIARLNECRFLNMSEPSQKLTIDSALLKTLLGRDKISARFLNKDIFEFYPKFKAFINCNYLPIIDDNTVFSSGRVNVITFDRHFKGHEQDKSLKDKLKNPYEISGIFNWCLEGLKKYNSIGLKQPKEIKQATNQYKLSNDKFTLFFEQELITSEKNTTFSDVYKRYEQWCKEKKTNKISKSIIMDRLRKEKLLVARATVNGKTKQNVIIGYELKESETENS